VLVTAGASAPEHLVEALLKRLHAEFGATIQQRNLVEEDMYFAPPHTLRRLAVLN